MSNIYRKKPILIEAVQFNGENILECLRFCPESKTFSKTIIIPTLEGDMICSLYDYIIKGIKGEYYPCKPDIFEQTYEKVN